MSQFDRKAHTTEEINIMVAEQLKLCIEPICKEIGKMVEHLEKRIVDLETAANAMLIEMKAWKEKHERTIQ